MGKRFVIEIEQGKGSTSPTDRRYSSYFIVGGNDVANLWDTEVERAAAAYAAKAAPATAPDGWEPKVGERVLVEGKVVLVEAESGYWISAHHGEQFAVGRSAIVGPAPKRARFAVGDEVVYIPTVEAVVVREANAIAGCYTVSQAERPTFIALEADLIALDEARERLAR